MFHQYHVSVTGFQIGLIEFTRSRYPEAIARFSQATAFNIFTGNIFPIYQGIRNLVPIPELLAELDHSSDKFILIPVVSLAKYLSFLCQIKLEEPVTKENARDFARIHVFELNRAGVWNLECIMFGEGISIQALLQHTRAMGHLLAFSLFKKVRDKKGARDELKRVKKYLGKDWPRYAQYQQDIKQL